MTTLSERIKDTFNTARKYKGIGIAESKVGHAVKKGLLSTETATRIIQGLWRLVKKNKGNGLTGQWK